MKGLCSRCKKPAVRASYKAILKDKRPPRYCKSCHAEYMRDWRKTHPLNPEQKKRANARSYAKTYLKRGKIKREGCTVCGEKAQMHHPDYSKPTLIVWLCRKHHLELHATL